MIEPYYADDTLTLLVGDAVEQLRHLPDGLANCVVTSPPYYGLRDYNGNPLQLGLEQTMAEYVARLVEVFRGVRRVLADDGTLWLNLGDSYAYPPGSAGKQGKGQRESRTFTAERLPGTRELPPKNLLGIPWRVALGLQDDGWILRNAIVWHKPNAMPEPVNDRLANRHELLFLLTKNAKYSFDLDSIREPHAAKSIYNRDVARRHPHAAGKASEPHKNREGDRSGWGAGSRELNEKGANPGDVWTIPTRPLREAHFAAFPIDLPRRCVLAGCKPGGTVLDPFSGAGTTAMAAQQLGRKAIGIDINAEYHDIALKRMSDAPLPFGGEAS